MKKSILLADGGAIQEYQEKLREEYPSNSSLRKRELSYLPYEVNKQVPTFSCDIHSSIFFTTGFEKSTSIIESDLSENWTIKTLSLAVSRYYKEDPVSSKYKYKLRFHSYISYTLGLVTQLNPSPIVLIVTNDAHLIPCMGDSRHRGCDTRILWWEYGITEEVSSIARAHNVPLVLLSAESRYYHKRDHILDGIMDSTKEEKS